MKDLRDLTDLTMHDVQPMSDEETTGQRHKGDQQNESMPHVDGSKPQPPKHLDLLEGGQV